MPARRIHILPSAAVVAPALEAIRTELQVPAAFPVAVEAEAAEVATRGPQLPPGASGAVEDRRDLPFVTIDPAGSRDLDQAYTAERRDGGGFRVFYAIADVNAFVRLDGQLDAESRRRGVTLYQPDRRTPLYPETLGQGAASLLPGQDRQALLWTIDLDADGMPGGHTDLRRATVRSRAALSYPEVQQTLDGGTAEEPLVLLREIGQRREQREIDRGGVSLKLPTQKVVVAGGRADLTYDMPLPVEGWNAQISLLAGIEAARIMLAGSIGILRTLPPPEDESIAVLRRSAAALGVAWPPSSSYAEFVRSLDPATAVGAALLNQAAHALRGAGYTAFDGPPPAQPDHSAVASSYAHVTAPLRRLADRFANEVVVSLCQDRRPPDWVVTALPELPPLMMAATRREHELEREVVNCVEALLLAHHAGEVFDATVISDDGGTRRTVQLRDPAVVGRLDGAVAVGQTISARLVEADPARRTVRFVPAG